jgi:hypothetical protein
VPFRAQKNDRFREKKNGFKRLHDITPPLTAILYSHFVEHWVVLLLLLCCKCAAAATAAAAYKPCTYTLQLLSTTIHNVRNARCMRTASLITAAAAAAQAQAGMYTHSFMVLAP